MVRKWLAGLVIGAGLILAAGCGAQEEAVVEPQDVSLTVASFGSPDPLIQERLKERFPDFTFTYLALNPGDMENLYRQESIPDLILDFDRILTPPHLLDKLQYDMTPLIQKYGLNLDQFEPGLIDHVRAYGDRGQVYAIPYKRFLYALFYNQNVFDKLHVPSPKDGMTWDETLDLARRTTVQADGVAYRGLDLLVSDVGYISLMDQHGLNLVDVKTGRGMTTSADWVRMASLFRSVYDIPGNRPPMTALIQPQEFYVHGRVAMTIGYSLDPLVRGAAGGQRIDLVTYPLIPEKPGTGPGTRTENITITSASPFKDEAFQVLLHLVSRDVQMENSRRGYGTVLKDVGVVQAMGADVPAANGKNVSALFAYKLPPISPISKYEGPAMVVASQFAGDLVSDAKSVETVLQEMELRINAAIAAEAAKEAP